MQVNSLGLTEAQPENNVQRIVLEALAVTLGRDARARAIQLPAWNEALGLPRPWDQQWSLRIQQVLAYETDILEYPDIFEGSKVMDGARRGAARGRARGDGGRGRARRRGRGGRLHEGGAGRLATASGCAGSRRASRSVVGQNRFTETEASPLTADADGGILVVDPALEAEQIEALRRWRSRARPGRPSTRRSRRSPRSPRDAAPENLMAADDRRRARGRDHRRVGADAARGVRQLPRAHRRRRGRRGPSASGS